ncbi:hypothetical protein PH505_bg00360 [Pseudoalteromonas distincta]|nr:hypothetical protein PH505_bg00360 [Pseudoalteromonas distincta]
MLVFSYRLKKLRITYEVFSIFSTVRDSTPPKPARLGLRVSSACVECLTEHFWQP